MQYVSTRGRAPAVSFTDAVLAGLAPDGGLYVPEAYPYVYGAAPESHFGAAAVQALDALQGGLAPHDAATAARAYDCGHAGPARWPEAVTHMVQLGPGHYALELFHGPSLSFKDIAMQLIAQLYDAALSQRGDRLTVVCATSGDTGGAAAEAFKASAYVDVFVLMPAGRVSDVQRRFMSASGAANVFALSVDGDFDDCQALVKAMFADRAFADQARLSGVNSINWARILAQSVYFRMASEALASAGPVDFAVPTGNFGDAFSGYVAKRMGAPVGRILLATNANDILTRALATGVYARAPASCATLSPAMDIQVASNFERIVFEALDRDGDHVARLYAQFAQSGAFDIPPRALEAICETFTAAAVDDAGTLAAMAGAARRRPGYLACPHTAVALAAWPAMGPSQAARVTLATAAPAKFPETVARATGRMPALPAHCADVLAREERLYPVANDLAAVQAFIQERSRAWRS